MKPLPYTVPERAKIRVIISTDAKNEADDQFAIAYAMMSPKLEVVGIVASHYYMATTWKESAHYTTDPEVARQTMQNSYDEVERVLDAMDLTGACKVLHGAEYPLADEKTPRISEGAQFIIDQAHTDGRPLYVINLGACTDMASAWLMDPTISKGIAGVLWLGGTHFPKGGWEFNLANDINAGNVLMDSDLPLWLLPNCSTAPLIIGYSELFTKVKPYGKIGEYLTEEMIRCGKDDPGTKGESWIMWDMAAVAVLLEGHGHMRYERNAPRFDEEMYYVEQSRPHNIIVYDRVEPRFTLEDFYCKLQLCFPKD